MNFLIYIGKNLFAFFAVTYIITSCIYVPLSEFTVVPDKILLPTSTLIAVIAESLISLGIFIQERMEKGKGR